MNSNINESEVYLTSKEAGEILGYTHDYISRLCRQGHMVGKRIGREWFVKPSDLEIFKKKHEIVLQEKKKQLSQKLSQIRKDHEAQKRAKKESIQKVTVYPTRPVVQSDVYKSAIKLVIPKQLVAICVLACVLLIPTIVDVVSSTPIVAVQNQKQTASVSQSTPVLSSFASSIAELPSVTVERISDIGLTYITIYEFQGQAIYKSMSEISHMGAIVLFGWELVGESFLKGSQNVIQTYSNIFGHMYQDSLGQTHAYMKNVFGGYQYVADTFSYALRSGVQIAENTSVFVFNNVSENITEMNKTITSLSYQVSASVGTFVHTKNQKNSSSEVIFVK